MKHKFVQYPSGDIKPCNTPQLWESNVQKSIFKQESLVFIKLTDKQYWFFKYLWQNPGFISPTKAGHVYTKFKGGISDYGSPIASPTLISLVKIGIAERDSRGWYRAI